MLMPKTIRARVALLRQIKNVKRKEGGNTDARYCFRCERRMNNCIKRGCYPYQCKMTSRSLHKVMADLYKLDKQGQPMRYYSDCRGIWFVQKWVTKLRYDTNLKIAFFAVIFYAHFQNMHTIHCVQRGFNNAVDFPEMKRRLKDCQRFGYTLYHAKTLGGGALKIPHFAKGIPSIIAAFRKLYNSPHFDALVKQLRTSIESFTAYRQFCADLEALRTDVPGLLGTSRLKCVLDVIVAAQWIQPRAVCQWPIDPRDRTAIALCRIYNRKTTSRKLLQIMLSELVHRLRCKGHHYDHHGTISMTLCLFEHLNSVS